MLLYRLSVDLSNCSWTQNSRVAGWQERSDRKDVVCGAWCVVWCAVCGVWCVVCGAWCVVPGVLRVVRARHYENVIASAIGPAKRLFVDVMCAGVPPVRQYRETDIGIGHTSLCLLTSL